MEGPCFLLPGPGGVIEAQAYLTAPVVAGSLGDCGGDMGGGPRHMCWSQCGLGQPGLLGTKGRDLTAGAPLPGLCWRVGLGARVGPLGPSVLGRPQPWPDTVRGGRVISELDCHRVQMGKLRPRVEKGLAQSGNRLAAP